MQKNDKVWLKPTSRNSKTDIEEYVIVKVGRKYIEVAKSMDTAVTIKFDLTNGYVQVSNYSPDWNIYFSKQEILDEDESLSLANQIREVLGNYGIPKELSLEKLRQIKKIIEH